MYFKVTPGLFNGAFLTAGRKPTSCPCHSW